MAWNDVDKTCEKCGQVTERVRGLTKQNVKRLFSIQLNFTELLITFMIIMVLLMAYLYKGETQICRDWINPMYEDKNLVSCLRVCDERCSLAFSPTESEYIVPNLKMLNELNFTKET